MLQFVFSLCRGKNEKWADPLLILLPGLCFAGNRQRLLRHFRRLKHEPVREKAPKNVFAGVFDRIESILFSSENRYRDSESHYFRVVFFLCANRNKAPKICYAFLFSFGLTFQRVVFVHCRLLSVCFFFCWQNNMPRKSSWSDEDREKLIDLVSNNPILWQNDLPDHMRADKNDDVWNGIGKVIGKASRNILQHSEKRSSARTS